MKLEERRERVIDEAVKATKIPESRREHYRRAWNKDPIATEALLRELAPAFGPSEVAATEAEGLPAEWFGGSPAATRPAGDVEAEGLPWVPIPDPARRGRVTIARDE